MSSESIPKIIYLSRHSFTERYRPHPNEKKKYNKLSNISNQAIIYNNQELQQIYTGLYLNKSLHNVGTYRWLYQKEVYHYEGKFHTNDLHGYGKMTYPNDSSYEGLFYCNKRFGPGIVTHSNQTQDVGLWNGKYLIRLCENFSSSEFYREFIPKLSNSLHGKLYLLQYKHLVPISENFNDPAADILEKLGQKDFAKKKLLYSKLVRNQKSMFIDAGKFYQNYFNYIEDSHLTVDVFDHFDENNEPVLKKVDVSNLLAWNNEEINIAIMKHSFFNRHHETILSYKIKDVLSERKRNNFLPAGSIEMHCKQLLLACRTADPTDIKKMISEHDLYPDLADSRGNNTVTYAAIAQHGNIIKVLAEFGANLNNINDDCLTPLMFLILQYIATKYDVSSKLWENAFINVNMEYNLQTGNQQWPPASNTSSTINCTINTSKVAFNESPETSHMDVDKFENNVRFSKNSFKRRESINTMEQDYILSLDCIRTKQEETKSVQHKTIDLSSKSVKSLHDIVEQNFNYEQSKIKQMETVTETMLTLLQCGANPNVGEVPFCPIITAIFSRSKEMVEMLIGFKAFVNVKTSNEFGYLGPLHVIASLKPCLEQLEMACVFLENGANVDDLSNSTHWLEESNILLAGRNLEEDAEKTPLHLICMRYDYGDNSYNYLSCLAILFLQFGANLNLKYLGHTPLTLAMMRGNTELMEKLLETGLVNPNEGLGYNMGVPLTVCILHRYSKLLPQSTIKLIFSILMRFYANPLNDVPDFYGNAIEFHCVDRRSIRNSRKSSTNDSGGNAFLLETGKSTLIKYVESKAVQILYNYKILCDFDCSKFNHIVKYLNDEKTKNILQILLDHDKIELNNTYFQKLLNYVQKSKMKSHVLKNSVTVKFEKSIGKYKKFQFENYMPEVDPNEEKYKVCFQCYQKTRKILVLCPKCELVYFCSAECNKINREDPGSLHPCVENFYDKEKSKNRTSTKFMDLELKRETLRQLLLSDNNISFADYVAMSRSQKANSLRELNLRQSKQDEGIVPILDVTTSAKKTISKIGLDTKDDNEKTGIRKGTGEIGTGKIGTGEKGTKETQKQGENVESDEKQKAREDKKRKAKDKKSDKAKEEAETNREKRDAKTKDKDEKEEVSKDGKKGQRKSRGKVRMDQSDDDAKEKRAKEKREKRRTSKKSMSTKTDDGDDDDKMISRKKGKGRKSVKGDKMERAEKSAGSKKRSGSERPTGRDTQTRKRSTSTVTDFGENKYGKVKLPMDNKKAFKFNNSAKEGILILIGSKKPIIDLEKRDMYMKIRAQMLEKDKKLQHHITRRQTLNEQYFKGKIIISNKCTEQMLQVARKMIPDISNEYKELDVKFWQIFMPYCFFENEQLFYKFYDGSGDIFYALTYSNC